jgi:lipopolysaccharide transport system permease protein
LALRTDTPIAEGTALVSRPWRDGEWSANRPPSRWWPRLDLRELFSYRELAVALATRDVKVKYKQTFFGVAWALFQPLFAVLVFSVVFHRIANVPTDDIPYPVFVYAGMTVWLYFSSSLTGAAQTLVDNRELITKIFFPRLLAPIAAVFPPLLDFGISLVILGVFLAVYGVVPGPELALLPLWVFAALVLALAVGLWLAALNVKYRDVRHVLPFMVQVWFFATPIVYSASNLTEPWQWVYYLNPVVALVEGFRWSVASGPPPGPEALVSLAVAVVLLVGGIAYFHRLEQFFGDLI